MYRKFSATTIFNGTSFLPKGAVLITNKEGIVIDIQPEKDAGDDIEKFNGILCPGFINTHCHLELSHLKGLIPEKTGLVEFVYKIITERHFAEEQILSSIEAAENEMLKNGIVAVGDICNNALTIPQKKKQYLSYHNFIEVSGFVPAVAPERFDKALQLLNAYKSNLPNQNSTLSPHAPYSVSPQLFELTNSFPKNNLLTIHNQESVEEDYFFKYGTGDFLNLYKKMGIDISFYNPGGKSSLQTVLPYLNNNQSLILVHNVTTTEEDIELIKLSTFFCLCPNANLYINNTLPDVNLLMKNNCEIILGTDSLASNHQLNILEEMKTLQKHYPSLSLQTLLQWATLNGAKALQMNAKLGSFEKGKQPGIVLIEGTDNWQLSKSSVAKRLL